MTKPVMFRIWVDEMEGVIPLGKWSDVQCNPQSQTWLCVSYFGKKRLQIPTLQTALSKKLNATKFF